jgi:hypothetical protein
MIYRLLADLILLSHCAFVAFAMLGGLLALRYPHVLWLHLPAFLWSVYVQWANRICPLTPLENYLRLLGGEAGYAGGFIEHYVLEVLYPDNLTLTLRYALGVVLIAMNFAVYACVIFRKRQHGHKVKPQI